MNASPALHPLDEVPIDPRVAALPKAELHLHAGALARLDRIVARREGRPPYDWREWVRQMMNSVPPGMPRLERLNGELPAAELDRLDDDPENFVERVADLLEEAAADGAVLAEVRFGGGTVLRPDFIGLFREAERRVQSRYPWLRAEAIICLRMPYLRDDRNIPEACPDAAPDGLPGVDLLPQPYDEEADWAEAYAWAERFAAAGLGITAHAGEFSPANVAAALHVPGLTRLGHAVHATGDPRLLEQLAHAGVTVECCLTCNVVLGATPSYAEHPIRRFIAAGIPVTLNSDDPERVCTTIGREYAIAAALGFTPDELLSFTRNAVRASFTSESRRTALMPELDAWEGAQAI